MRYRKRPVEVEAVEVRPENINQLMRLTNGGSREATYYWGDGKLSCIMIKTLEGTMRADIGDFLIKGIKGEFYPCKPDIFKQTYEPVESAP